MDRCIVVPALMIAAFVAILALLFVGPLTDEGQDTGDEVVIVGTYAFDETPKAEKDNGTERELQKMIGLPMKALKIGAKLIQVLDQKIVNGMDRVRVMYPDQFPYIVPEKRIVVS